MIGWEFLIELPEGYDERTTLALVPGDLLGLRYRIQLQKHYERQIKLLKTKLSEIDDGAANDAVEDEVKRIG